MYRGAVKAVRTPQKQVGQWLPPKMATGLSAMARHRGLSCDFFQMTEQSKTIL